MYYYKTPINPDLADVTYKKYDYKNQQGQTVITDEDCNNLPTYCNDNAEDLKYYVYYPADFDYANCKPPAIILFHGGGFTDCKGSLEATAIQFMCREFAKRGYVAFDVEYRRGRYVDPTGTYFTAQQSLAIYRSMQDARGAIRSIIKHQNRHNQE